MIAPDLVLTGLWDAPAPPATEGPGFSLVLGPAHLPSWALISLCAVLGAGGRVFWIDASNRFDLYGLARAAQARRLDPRAVLGRVELARPFTAFQLERITRSELLPRPARSAPAVLSDPLALLYDEDLPAEDARRLCGSFLDALDRLRMPALVLSVQRRPPAGREPFARELMERAGAVATLTDGGGAWRLESFRRRDGLPASL